MNVCIVDYAALVSWLHLIISVKIIMEYTLSPLMTNPKH